MHARRWLLVALILSLAGNIALAGFVAGRMSMPGPLPASFDPSIGLFRVLHQLPDARREALRPVLREHFHALRQDLAALRTSQRRINAVLEEPDYDPAELSRALGEFRSALLASQQVSHESLVRVASAMTPQERLLLRDAMTRRGPAHRGPGYRKDRREPE